MKIGRNDVCFCGSGKKYKKCCLGREIPEEFKHHPQHILPDRWNIDFGEPLLDNDFFDQNELSEISAAKMLHMSMVLPDIMEEVANRVRQETTRHLEQAQEIACLSGSQDIINFLKKEPDRLNYPLILKKFLAHEDETVALLLEELKTADKELFVELAVRLLYDSDLDFVDELMEIIELHQHNAYVVSIVCLLLGFYREPAVPKVLWDYFHYFKNNFPGETYAEGPLLGLYEIKDDVDEGASIEDESVQKDLWDEDVLAAMNDQTILDRLKGFGVPLEKEALLKDIQRCRSVDRLTDEWTERYSVSAIGYDEDFLWYSCRELLKRWAPEIMYDERMSDMIDQGDDLLLKQKDREACDLWLELWGHFKMRYAGLVRSVEEADRESRGDPGWHDWCQDFEMHLINAVRCDRVYGPKAIAYFREFRRLLPETSDLIMQNMMMAEADVLFLCGDTSSGERLFQEVIERYPTDVWGYMRWGDVYAPGMKHGSNVSDPVRAESIYRMALGRGLKDESEVKRRIKGLK